MPSAQTTEELPRRPEPWNRTDVELISPAEGEVLDLTTAFRRPAPLEVDLGCGDGTFLTQLAALSPERNFLGIEQMAGRVRSACGQIARRELSNARILRSELAYATGHLLPPASVRSFYLMFPDPWPKRRHHGRRVFTDDWLRCVEKALVPNGKLRIATDHADYFRWMQRRALRRPALASDPLNEARSLPVSTFEQRFLALGGTIHRMTLRKIST